MSMLLGRAWSKAAPVKRPRCDYLSGTANLSLAALCTRFHTSVRRGCPSALSADAAAVSRARVYLRRGEPLEVAILRVFNRSIRCLQATWRRCTRYTGSDFGGGYALLEIRIAMARRHGYIDRNCSPGGDRRENPRMRRHTSVRAQKSCLSYSNFLTIFYRMPGSRPFEQ